MAGLWAKDAMSCVILRQNHCVDATLFVLVKSSDFSITKQFILTSDLPWFFFHKYHANRELAETV